MVPIFPNISHFFGARFNGLGAFMESAMVAVCDVVVDFCVEFVLMCFFIITIAPNSRARKGGRKGRSMARFSSTCNKC